MERSNPELASAMRKLEPHAKRLHDPQQAQKAMSRLTREERAALLEMQEQQGVSEPEAINRQMRRRRPESEGRLHIRRQPVRHNHFTHAAQRLIEALEHQRPEPRRNGAAR